MTDLFVFTADLRSMVSSGTLKGKKKREFSRGLLVLLPSALHRRILDPRQEARQFTCFEGLRRTFLSTVSNKYDNTDGSGGLFFSIVKN